MLPVKHYVIMICLLSACRISSQDLTAKKLSLQDCIEIALKNNDNVKTAALETTYEHQLKKTSSELPKTDLSFMQGQFNSIYKYDNNITVRQTIPFPTVISGNRALAKERIKSSEFRSDVIKADLTYKVKTTYYTLVYLESIHQLLLREDSIFKEFAKAGAKKFGLGEGTFLEKTTSETQSLQIENQLMENEGDRNATKAQLRTLMNSAVNVEIADLNMKNDYLTVIIDTTAVVEHPMLKFLKQQIEVSKKMRSLEGARAMPDISVGYFNQSIYGQGNIEIGHDYYLTTKDRLQGFLLGLSVPIWFYPHKAKIRAAEINTQVVGSEYNYNASVLSGEYKEAVSAYLKYRNSLNFYKNVASVNGNLIMNQAVKSYKAGEIAYVEYLQSLNRALEIENNYLNAINNNNQAVLRINYLLSK
jgi:cobalt-zinc-cadmium resistance protein CzcA